MRRGRTEEVKLSRGFVVIQGKPAHSLAAKPATIGHVADSDRRIILRKAQNQVVLAYEEYIKTCQQFAGVRELDLKRVL